MMDTTYDLATEALAAAEEHEAAAVAKTTEARTLAAQVAATDLAGTMAELIGDRPYTVRKLETERLAHWTARVHAGGLTLMVERDLAAPRVTLMAACIDCGRETPFGDYITTLAELGMYVRQSQTTPCLPCSVGRHPSAQEASQEAPGHKAWTINRYSDHGTAEEELNKLTAQGFMGALHVVYDGDDVSFVVSGHDFDAARF